MTPMTSCWLCAKVVIITRKHWYPADVCSHCKGVASEENIYIYYIDRCELWGFLREINSGISHVRYQFLKFDKN
jgi:hypothetical protein